MVVMSVTHWDDLDYDTEPHPLDTDAFDEITTACDLDLFISILVRRRFLKRCQEQEGAEEFQETLKVYGDQPCLGKEHKLTDNPKRVTCLGCLVYLASRQAECA
jgi:hypothetical protein